MDSSWQRLREQHERIRWARLHCTPFARPTDAARSMNIKPGTYRTYELAKADGGRTPILTEVQKIARKYGVSWQWIVSGEGSPEPAAAGMRPSLAEVLSHQLETVDPDKKEDAIRAVEGVLQAFQRKAG